MANSNFLNKMSSQNKGNRNNFCTNFYWWSYTNAIMNEESSLESIRTDEERRGRKIVTSNTYHIETPSSHNFINIKYGK